VLLMLMLMLNIPDMDEEDNAKGEIEKLYFGRLTARA